MLIDFSQTFTLPDGKAFTDADGSKLSLGKIALQSLNATGQAREPLPLSEAMRRGSLAIKVAGGGKHEISVEDAALIRQTLPNFWSPIVVALAAQALDGAPEPMKEAAE